MKKLPLKQFYDLKLKKKFSTNKYKIILKNGRYFAIADAPSKIKSWLIVSKVFGKKYM